MNESDKTLVIIVSDLYIRGYIISLKNEMLAVLNTQQYLKTASDQELIQAIQFEFQGQFNKSVIISDLNKVLEDVTGKISAGNVTVVMNVNGATVSIVIGILGRIVYSKKYDFGFSHQLANLLLPENRTLFEQRLALWGYDNEKIRTAYNYLGNRQMYKGIPIVNKESEDALMGILWLICLKNELNTIIAENTKGLRFEEIPHVILTGEIAQEFIDQGNLALSLIDGFKLTGIWQLILDPRMQLLLYSQDISEDLSIYSLEELESIGSVIAFDSPYNWGEYIGEMRVDLGLSEDQVVDLKCGQIIRIPLSKQVSGGLTIKAKPNVVINYQGEIDKLAGGNIGLIIDTRNRPLPDLSQTKIYNKHMHHWIEALH